MKLPKAPLLPFALGFFMLGLFSLGFVALGPSVAAAEDGQAPPRPVTITTAPAITATPAGAPADPATLSSPTGAGYRWPDRSWREPAEDQALRPIRQPDEPRRNMHALRLDVGPLVLHGTLAIEYETQFFWKAALYVNAYIPVAPEHQLADAFEVDFGGLAAGLRFHFSRHNLEGFEVGLGVAAGRAIYQETSGETRRGFFGEFSLGYGGTIFGGFSVSFGLTILYSFDRLILPWPRAAIGAVF